MRARREIDAEELQIRTGGLSGQWVLVLGRVMLSINHTSTHRRSDETRVVYTHPYAQGTHCVGCMPCWLAFVSAALLLFCTCRFILVAVTCMSKGPLGEAGRRHSAMVLAAVLSLAVGLGGESRYCGAWAEVLTVTGL